MKIAASAATATFALALAAVTGAQVAGPRPADTFLRRSADEMQVKIFDQAQGSGARSSSSSTAASRSELKLGR